MAQNLNWYKPMEDRTVYEATLEEKALTFPEQARALSINSNADYLAAGEFLKSVDAMAREVESTFKPLVDEAHRHHKSLIAEMNRHLEPLKAAKATTKGLMIGWDRLQEEKRRQEETRLREEARKREEEAKLAQAIEAEQAGDIQEAEAIMSEPVYVAPVVVKKDVPKVAGLVFRTVWKFRISDEARIPREYLTPDLVKIGQVARATKGTLTIPGVEVYEEKV